MRKISHRILILSLVLLLFIVIALAITANGLKKGTQKSLFPNGNILLVGSFNGYKSGFTNIQAALNAAKPNDYILLAPGYYSATTSGSIVINKPNIHLMGLNENTVVIGPSLTSSTSSSNSCAQNGSSTNNATSQNQNGIVIENTGDTIENLTVCNFLASNNTNMGAQIFLSNNNPNGDPINAGISYVKLTYSNQTKTQPQPQAVSNYGVMINGNVNLKFNYSSISNFAGAGMYVSGCTNCNIYASNLNFQNSFSGMLLKSDSGIFTVTNSQFLNNFSSIDAIDVNKVSQNNNTFCGSGVTASTSTLKNLNNLCSTISDNQFNLTSAYSGTSITNYNQSTNANLYDNFNLTGQFPDLPYGVGVAVLGSDGFSIENNSFSVNNLWATTVADLFLPSTNELCSKSVNLANTECVSTSQYVTITNNRAVAHQSLFLNISPFEDLGVGLNNNQVCIKNNLLNSQATKQTCDTPNVNMFTTDGLILNCISNSNCTTPTINLIQAKLKLFGTALGANVSGLDNPNTANVAAIKFSPGTINLTIPAVTDLINICRLVPANKWCP